MNTALDKILISYEQPDFPKNIKGLYKEMLKQARFGGFDKNSEKCRQQVLRIIREVDRPTARAVDKAVRKFTKKFDGVELEPCEFKIALQELRKAHDEIDSSLLASIRGAIRNVRKYQEKIFIGNKSIFSGHLGIRYRPIEKVGICVPGASAPLPSTVIMTAVPALVAGVRPENIVVVSPPRYKPAPEAKATIHPVILAVCHELKIHQVYRIGGAQAVAALASGRGIIPAVNKIVGPGNRWVQTAKQMVLGDVDIDSMAGASEVLIIANDEAEPAWVAADMLSQAEHDPGSAVVFTDSKKFAREVLDELKKQVKLLNRARQTILCLKKYGRIAVFQNMRMIVEEANNFAAEHLEIQCGNKSREIAAKIENAGAIFIGNYSPVAAGDYWAGPSHTLPTGQTAKFFSALSANDFIKATSIIEYDKRKLAQSAEDIIRLAMAEGLDGHAKSIQIRQHGKKSRKT